MPRVVVQPRIVKEIQKEVIRFDCDFCGKECGTRANPKQIIDRGREKFYYCKKSGCWHKAILARTYFE
jgi:hypothetical protein